MANHVIKQGAVLDTYTTTQYPAHVEIPKIKGSRFIGEALPLEEIGMVPEMLKVIQKREYNASHWCWAYRFGVDPVEVRSNDDGEPSGSAGLPILRQIERSGFTSVLVVVTRYFGGTKLGTGGLVRAYGEAAEAVLQICAPKEVILRKEVRLAFAYPDTSAAMHCIQQFDAPIIQTQYSDLTELTVAVRNSQVEALKTNFIEALRGKGHVSYP
ncbi:MAG: YigZ family protein [Bacteroidetes Order II. Incertae sedis bacterium]|nr:YigZ family protein [Bacteroidetes Order II. bacterium]